MIRKPVEPVVTDYLYRKAARMGMPLSGTFELTPLCNMNCKMCYVRLDQRQQAAIRPLATAEQWLALGKAAKDGGMLYLLLTGGEPFSHPECKQIIQGLHEMGLLLSVNTNGTLIDETAIAWLKEAPPTRVNVTLYGASNETYEKLCGDGEGFTRTVRAIALLRSAGIPVKINCSVTPDNVADLPKIAAYCKENQLVLQTNTYMFPPLRKDDRFIGRNFRFSPEEAAYYTAVSELVTEGSERFMARQVPAPEPTEDCREVGDGVRCRAGRCSFWVTWAGKLLPCGMFTLPDCPNVFESDFLSAWERIKEQVAQIRLPAQCAGCELKDSCRACAAMVYTESGNFRDVPAYRCQMAHQFLPQREKLKARLMAGPDPTRESEGK